MLVSVQNLSKVYGTKTNPFVALKNISLEIHEGEFLAFAGSSGSGKTTLLNILGAIDTPTSGKVFIHDRDISVLNDNDLAHFRSHNLGYIFQTFNLIPVLTVIENVEYPLLKLKHISNNEKKNKAAEILKMVGLEKHLHKFPNELSGGQRQRVAIARALVHNPQLIIADEPTANLDKKTAHEILQLMHQMNKKNHVTFVFSTHDPAIISMAERVIYLSDGEICSD